MGFRAERTSKQISDFNNIPIDTVRHFKIKWENYLAEGGDPDNFYIRRNIQMWCKDNLAFFWDKEMWPPSSPDINPLDFFV